MVQPDQNDRLLSIEDVSALLQIPVATIYKQRSMGRFCPAYKIGRHLRWKHTELLAWIDTKRDAV